MTTPEQPFPDPEFERLMASLGDMHETPHQQGVDIRQLTPLARAAVEQLPDHKAYMPVPLPFQNIAAPESGHDMWNCSHDTVTAIAGFLLTLDDSSPKPRVEPLLVPPYGLSPAAYLEHCRDQIKQYSDFVPGMFPLTQQSLSVFLKSNATLIASVVQKTDHTNLDQVCTSLHVPAVFMHAISEPEATMNEAVVDGIKLTATVFDWLSSLHLSALRKS